MSSDHSLQMVTEGDFGAKAIILTSPLLMLEGESDVNYRPPNILQRVFSLLKNVHPGSDLTRLQVPAVFNIPKSQLQIYGESLYCFKNDLLNGCANGENPIDRFTSVVGWSISTIRPIKFGVAPYNPILGETHHVSHGSLNVLLEQVSHHPPVSALHATDEERNLEMIWCHCHVPKFSGGSVVTEVLGKKELKVLDKGEIYVMNCPKLMVTLIPVAGVDWIGNVTVRCEKTGLQAELCYCKSSFLSRRSNHRAIKGRIFMSSSLKTIFEINGHWDRTVTIKDISNGMVKVIYDAKEMISELKTPVVKDLKKVWPSESAVVWSKVSECILTQSWEKANEAKKAIEEKERELARERKSTWVPKHFSISYKKENEWDCLPNQKWVPPAPVIAHL